MRQWYYPTAFSCWGDEEAAAIARVIRSSRFTQGEEVAAFEREFADYHGRKYGVMVNSGSSANLLMVAALKQIGAFKPGDKAIVPAVAWSTTYAPLVQHELDLVVVDVDDTWNANPELFRVHPPGAIKVIVACSILGNPAYLAEWQNVADVLGATLIEDNCESLGAVTRAGRKTGTFGLMSSASFFWSHQIGAIEGGMVLTDDETCWHYLRMLRAHGWTRDCEAWDKPTGFHGEYDFRVMGYNVRGLELHAAIAREQLKKLPTMIMQRTANAGFFSHAIGHLPVIPPLWSGTESPFGIQFEVADGSRRQALADALREAGIDCRLPTGGSFLKHAYGAPWRNQDTPAADRIHDRGMFIGNGPLDLTVQIGRAVEVMRKVL